MGTREGETGSGRWTRRKAPVQQSAVDGQAVHLISDALKTGMKPMLIMVSGKSGVLNGSYGNTGVGCLFGKTQHENTRTLGKKRASNTDEANEINKSVENTSN